MKRASLIALILGVVFILPGCFYIQDEMHQSLLLQFRKIVRVDSEPGLKMKLPFIQSVVMLEKRIMAWDGEPGEMTTGDKKRIFIDSSARWYIDNPELFFVSLGSEMQAHSRLDDLIDSEVRKSVALYRVDDLVRGSDRELTYLNEEEDMRQELENHAGLSVGQGGLDISTPGLFEGDSVHPAEREDQPDAVSEEMSQSNERATEESLKNPVQGGTHKTNKRNAIMEAVGKAVDDIARKQFGIRVLNVSIKRLNYADVVQERIFEKMVSERKAIAEKYRSTGQGLADKIRGDKEKKLKEILSQGQRQAEIIRGEGDAKAARIYATAYGADPEFYVFMKRLETYRMAVDENTEMILPLNSDTFRWMADSP